MPPFRIVDFHHPQIGIAAGLVLGKPLGVGVYSAALKKEKLTHWTCPTCDTVIPLSKADAIKHELGFAPKKPSKDADTSGPMVAIIDEASMVDENLARDIETYLPPNYAVLYVGDKGQLPPVGGKWGADFEHPDAALTKVHRQSADNPILNLATRIREGKNNDAPFALDVLAAGVVLESMIRIVDGRATESRGLAFDAAPNASAPRELGFEFRFSRRSDTVGWYDPVASADAYTLANIRLDVVPVRVAQPLFGPWHR
jgi:hypothetical protein